MRLTITMKAKKIRSYVKPGTGNTVFVYGVTGTAEELARYKEVQGANYKEDENGNPLFFTTNFAGDSPELIITQKNKVIADMSDFAAAASLSKQFGGNLGQELARAAAEKLMGHKSASVPQSVPSKEDLPE
jgi:hypothetical protein